MGVLANLPTTIRLVPAAAGASAMVMIAFLAVFAVGQWFEYRSAIDVKRSEMLEDSQIVAGYTAELVVLAQSVLQRETDWALEHLSPSAVRVRDAPTHPAAFGPDGTVPLRLALLNGGGSLLYSVGDVDSLLQASASGEVPLPGAAGDGGIVPLSITLISPANQPGSRWLRLSRRIGPPRSVMLRAYVFVDLLALRLPPRLMDTSRPAVDFALAGASGTIAAAAPAGAMDAGPLPATSFLEAALPSPPSAGGPETQVGAWLSASSPSPTVPLVVTLRAPLLTAVSYWQAHHRKMLGLVMAFGMILAAVTAFSWLLVVKPIKSVRRAVSSIRSGHLAIPVKVRPSLLDVRELAEGVEEMRRSLFDLTRHLQAAVDLRTRELAHTNQQLWLALRHMSHGLIMVDPSGHVTVSNANCFTILDLPASLGSPGVHVSRIFLAFARRHRDHFGRSWRLGNMMRCAILSLTSPRGGPVELPLGDGRVARVRSALKPSGGLLATVEDITEDRRIEGELREAAACAEQASRAKSAFLANMSHELRTPLNGVIGFSELILSEISGPIGNDTYAEYLRHINASGRHLLDLINDILDLTKAEAGHLEIVAGDVDIEQLVRDCINLVAEAARQNQISVSTRFHLPIPAVRSDERRVRQILLNLLSNAIKFTKKSGEVLAEVRPSGNGGVAIYVVDTGIGMAESDVSIAIEPFRQIDSSLSRRFEGTGLGLPLTKRLAELLGGTLTIWSKVGQGTSVKVELPSLSEDRMPPSARAAIDE